MYQGTTLVSQATLDEINRALLDLLKKLNELSVRISKLEKKLENN